MLIPEAADDEAHRRAVREKTLANLRPFRPGQSGNPAGRREGGAYIAEFINAFLTVGEDGHPNYTRRDLEVIVADPQSAPAAVAAARQVLKMMQSGQKYVKDKRGKVYPAGTDPEVGKAFDRVMDRLVGKPVMTHHVHDDRDGANRPPAELNDRIMAMLTANPALRDYMLKRVLSDLNEKPALRDYLLASMPANGTDPAPGIAREIIDQPDPVPASTAP